MKKLLLKLLETNNHDKRNKEQQLGTERHNGYGNGNIAVALQAHDEIVHRKDKPEQRVLAFERQTKKCQAGRYHADQGHARDTHDLEVVERE